MIIVVGPFRNSFITPRLQLRVNRSRAHRGAAIRVDDWAISRLWVPPWPADRTATATVQPMSITPAVHRRVARLLEEASVPRPSANSVPPINALAMKDENDAAPSPIQNTTVAHGPSTPRN